MIIFNGELSKKCILTRAKKISNKNGMMFLIATVITSIIVLTFGIKNDALYYSLALIILLLVITSFAFYVPKKNC